MHRLPLSLSRADIFSAATANRSGLIFKSSASSRSSDTKRATTFTNSKQLHSVYLYRHCVSVMNHEAAAERVEQPHRNLISFFSFLFFPLFRLLSLAPRNQNTRFLYVMHSRRLPLLSMKENTISYNRIRSLIVPSPHCVGALFCAHFPFSSLPHAIAYNHFCDGFFFFFFSFGFSFLRCAFYFVCFVFHSAFRVY